MEPKFFATQADFRGWLMKNHHKVRELWVGFYKKATGKPSLTWPESVDEALCFGWIDGIRKSIDGESYRIRFTPRKSASHWSAKNVRRARELKGLGLMQPAGLAAFESRDEQKSRQASSERQHVELSPAYREILSAHEGAWAYYQDSAPSYRKQTAWWVMSAKKEETRLRRLRVLIDSCEKGEVVPPLKWTDQRKK